MGEGWWGWWGAGGIEMKKKATRLCDPDAHNLRTRYIQNRRAGQRSSEEANELLWEGPLGVGGGGCAVT